MLMSTSRIEDLLQQHLADDSREELEGSLVDRELHVFLAERAAFFDFRGERGLQARDVGLEFRDPTSRLGLGARELVGHPRELGAEQGRVEVGREQLPAARMVSPEDVAGAILFLCSPDAEMIRGQTLVVDGGQSLLLHTQARV